MTVLNDLIAAHMLRFERPERAPYDVATGTRMLVAFALVGLVLHPALGALARATGVAGEYWVGPAMVVTLLLAVVFLMRAFVGSGAGTIGLHRYGQWTPRERLYAWTLIPPVAVAFGIVFRERFSHLAEVHGMAGLLLVTVPTGLLWGMVQEFIYRGLLQTELTRRLGGTAGVLLANLVFTFGPLHFMYFGLDTGAGPRWGMFATIFGIGLIFGLLYRRSGNLWIPAIMHGLWPPNMT